MSENEFNLFKQLKKDKKKLQIEELRALIQNTMNKKNELVQKIWKINIQLASLEQENEDSNALRKKKIELEQQLKTGNYSSKIAELTNSIHDLEVEVYGKSDFGNKSLFNL